jgi:hypothetical protein
VYAHSFTQPVGGFCAHYGPRRCGRRDGLAQRGAGGWEEAGPQKLPDVYERGSEGIVRAAPRTDKGQKERAGGRIWGGRPP